MIKNVYGTGPARLGEAVLLLNKGNKKAKYAKV
jgi:hypothetical protein